MLPDFIEVLVPDNEESLYKEKIVNPILTIPHELEGLGLVRNWCLQNFEEETVIMLDDDIKIVYNLEGRVSRRIADKDVVLEILVNDAIMAKDLGVGCFGFTQTDIRKYNATKPFELCTWVGGVIGVIGKGIAFRNDKFKVDIDFCLQNLMLKRIIWCDNRYLFSQLRDNNRGGNSIFRNKDEYDKSLETLKNKWGSYIKVGKHKGQVRITLNVKRKQNIKL